MDAHPPIYKFTYLALRHPPFPCPGQRVLVHDVADARVAGEQEPLALLGGKRTVGVMGQGRNLEFELIASLPTRKAWCCIHAIHAHAKEKSEAGDGTAPGDFDDAVARPGVHLGGLRLRDERRTVEASESVGGTAGVLGLAARSVCWGDKARRHVTL